MIEKRNILNAMIKDHEEDRLYAPVPLQSSLSTMVLKCQSMKLMFLLAIPSISTAPFLTPPWMKQRVSSSGMMVCI
jgi:hypothetical protein